MSVSWTSGLQPIIFFSAYDPSVPPATPWAIRLRALGPNVYRTLITIGAREFESWAAPIDLLSAPRSALRMRPGGKNPITFGHYSPHLNLALFSKLSQHPQPDWPANTVQAGFPFYDSIDSTQPAIQPEIDDFLQAGPAPIVFTLGTAAVRDARRFYHDSIAAAQASRPARHPTHRT